MRGKHMEEKFDGSLEIKATIKNNHFKSQINIDACYDDYINLIAGVILHTGGKIAKNYDLELGEVLKDIKEATAILQGNNG